MECGGQAQQFIVGQAEFPPAWMAMVKIVVDRKGLIEQDTIGFERINQPGEQWAVEVETDDEDIVAFGRKLRPLFGRALKID